MTAPGADRDLDAEDAKLVTLARSVLARAGTSAAAAVRDSMGRTYDAGSVDLPSLRLSAVQAAVAAAVSSGARQLEAVAVVGDDAGVDERALLADVGDPPVHRR